MEGGFAERAGQGACWWRGFVWEMTYRKRQCKHVRTMRSVLDSPLKSRQIHPTVTQAAGI